MQCEAKFQFHNQEYGFGNPSVPLHMFSSCWKWNWCAGLYWALGSGSFMIVLFLQESLSAAFSLPESDSFVFFICWFQKLVVSFSLSTSISSRYVPFLFFVPLKPFSYSCHYLTILYGDLANFFAVDPCSDKDTDWMLCWYDLALFCNTDCLAVGMSHKYFFLYFFFLVSEEGCRNLYFYYYFWHSLQSRNTWDSFSTAMERTRAR